MKTKEFGISGQIHPKDKTGFIGASIPEIGLFTQASTLKKLEQSIKDAFFDLFESKIRLNVSFQNEESFVLSSADVTSFYALILRGVRGEKTYREAMRILKDKSTAALHRYENGKSTPSLEKAIELLAELCDEDSGHVLVWMPKHKSVANR